MAISLELLTDEDILDYSRSDGKDHVLFSHGDLNLKYDRLQPIVGGVYDVEIFGSPMVDRCICGKIHSDITVFEYHIKFLLKDFVSQLIQIVEWKFNPSEAS